MRTRLTLQPDQDGAKELREKYGERLVCVRYRYDEATKERWKTVELIIDKSVWEPSSKWSAETLVALRVAAQEREVRQRVKAAGGKWNPKEGVWELAYGQVVTLGLRERIVAEVNAGERNPHLLIDGTGIGRPSANR
jgi:hypothetical protein